MARILKGYHSFTCTARVRPQQNEPYLPLPSQPKLVLIYLPRRDGRLSWPWVAGWLHTEISVWHWELNPDTVAYLSTYWARRRLTSLIEANVLTTIPDHQYMPSVWTARWHIELSIRLAIRWSRGLTVVQTLLCDNDEYIVYTLVPLLPSGIIWYSPKVVMLHGWKDNLVPGGK